jgi:hypothetical protein
MKYEFEIVTIPTTAYLPPAAVWYDLDDGGFLEMKIGRSM